MESFIDYISQGSENKVESMPEYKELAIDFETGEFIIENGDIKIVTKVEAILVWVYKALHTDRFKYRAYSEDYGNDLKTNLGYVYDVEIRKQLITSEIAECLLVNPYITNVYDFEITTKKAGIDVDVKFTIDTIYGTAKTGVDNIGI